MGTRAPLLPHNRLWKAIYNFFDYLILNTIIIPVALSVITVVSLLYKHHQDLENVSAPASIPGSSSASYHHQSSALSLGQSSLGNTPPWGDNERSIYELQLQNLQEQLMEITIKNQGLGRFEYDGNFTLNLMEGGRDMIYYNRSWVQVLCYALGQGILH